MDVGQVLAERYRLVRPLQPGGHKRVWVAEHLALGGTLVAVQLVGGPEDGARIASGANAAAALKSPHVVHVLDHGVEGDQAFVVLELLEGQNLEERLRKTQKLTLEHTTSIVTQVARALTKAHAAGLVHGDVRPHQIFLATDDDQEVAKLIGFELPHGPEATTPPEGLLYRSPEQLRGEAPTAASDVFALGVVAYQCVTGKAPFMAVRPAQLLARYDKGEAPPPASRMRPGIPGAFDAWVAHACANDPSERFASAREMAEALAVAAKAPLEGRRPSMLPPIGASLKPAPKPPPEVRPAPQKAVGPGASLAAKPPAKADAIVPKPIVAITSPKRDSAAEIDTGWGEEDATSVQPRKKLPTIPPPAAPRAGTLVGVGASTLPRRPPSVAPPAASPRAALAPGRSPLATTPEPPVTADRSLGGAERRTLGHPAAEPPFASRDVDPASLANEDSAETGVVARPPPPVEAPRAPAKSSEELDSSMLVDRLTEDTAERLEVDRLLAARARQAVSEIREIEDRITEDTADVLPSQIEDVATNDPATNAPPARPLAAPPPPPPPPPPEELSPASSAQVSEAFAAVAEARAAAAEARAAAAEAAAKAKAADAKAQAAEVKASAAARASGINWEAEARAASAIRIMEAPAPIERTPPPPVVAEPLRVAPPQDFSRATFDVDIEIPPELDGGRRGVVPKILAVLGLAGAIAIGVVVVQSNTRDDDPPATLAPLAPPPKPIPPAPAPPPPPDPVPASSAVDPGSEALRKAMQKKVKAARAAHGPHRAAPPKEDEVELPAPEPE